MASEIRVNKINSSTGVGTITLSPTGVDISGITTVSTLKVGTGVTASEDGDIFFTGVCTATTFAGAHSGSGANLTSLPAAQLTGALPAISGANLTGIAATDNVRTGILDVAGIATFRNNVNIGAAVTISESGIEASGIGITVANINGGAISGRRRININGDMRVAQRNTSVATQDGVEGYKTLDRWRLLYSSSAGGEATMSQDSDVPTDYSWGKFSKSLKMDVTTADTSVSTNHAITLQYRMEAQDLRNSGWDYTNPNSILSVSFWAKSVKAGTYCVALNSQDASPNLDIIKEYTLVANTWKHVEFEIPGNSSLVIDDDNGSGMNFLWALVVGTGRHLAAGSWTARSGEAKYGSSNQVNFYDSTDNNFYLTGVQIEVGKPTVFEHHSFAEELSLCQRYCYVVIRHDGSMSGAKALGGSGSFYTNDDVYMNMDFPVTMRSTPTLSCVNKSNAFQFPAASSGHNANTLTLIHGHTNGCTLWTTTSSTTTPGYTSNPYFNASNTTEGDSVIITAEL